jgi:hypothetical protein
MHEPWNTGPQDSYDPAGPHPAPYGGYLSRDVDGAIAWMEREHDDPTQSWSNLCQSACRQSYGVAAWSDSAKNAWRQIPSSKRVDGGSPFDAPRGALIYFDSGTYGHVALCKGKTTDDKAWSNDYVSDGDIDSAPRDFPRWGLHYVGWSTWTPYGSMRLDQLWDGVVPSLEGCFNAMNHGYANPQAFRLACRLHDLGFFSGTPVEGSQRYPAKAVAQLQASASVPTNPQGAYSPELHDWLFG